MIYAFGTLRVGIMIFYLKLYVSIISLHISNTVYSFLWSMSVSPTTLIVLFHVIVTVENMVSNCRIHFSFSLSSGPGW